MTYTLIANPDYVVRDEDRAFIPTDPDNRDYQEYLGWLDEGNQPTPYTPVELQGAEDNGDTPDDTPQVTVVKSGGRNVKT